MGRPRIKTEEQKRKENIKRNIEYNSKHTIRLPINLNTNTDRDIIDFLTSIPNKQGYIKDLIRLDMEGRNLRYELTDTPDDTYDTDTDDQDDPVSPSIE